MHNSLQSLILVRLIYVGLDLTYVGSTNMSGYIKVVHNIVMQRSFHKEKWSLHNNVVHSSFTATYIGGTQYVRENAKNTTLVQLLYKPNAHCQIGVGSTQILHIPKAHWGCAIVELRLYMNYDPYVRPNISGCAWVVHKQLLYSHINGIQCVKPNISSCVKVVYNFIVYQSLISSKYVILQLVGISKFQRLLDA